MRRGAVGYLLPCAAWLFLVVTQGWSSEAPVFADARLVVRSPQGWFAAAGAALYSSDGVSPWQLWREAPTRIRLLTLSEGQPLAAGRGFLLTAAQSHALAGETVGLAGPAHAVLALTQQGQVTCVRGESLNALASLPSGWRYTALCWSEDTGWLAAGSRAGGSALWRLTELEGAWRAVEGGPLPPVQHLVATNGIVLAFSSTGALHRSAPLGRWLEVEGWARLTDAAPAQVLASPQDGFVAVLNNGVVRSWDGHLWSRLTFNDENTPLTSIASTPEGLSLLTLGTGGNHPQIETTLLRDLAIPGFATASARDLAPSDSLSSAIATWDRTLVESQDARERLESSLQLLRTHHASGQARRDSVAWWHRAAQRLGRLQPSFETTKPFLDALFQIYQLRVTLSPEREAATEATQPEEHPALFPLELTRQRAGNGQVGAMIDLAVAYGHGAGLRTDPHSAQFWYDWAREIDPSVPPLASFGREPLTPATLQKLTDAGSTWAAVLLGDSFREGRDVEMDFSAAAVAYRRAASLGSYDGAVALGELYLLGWGVDKDPATALALFADPGRALHPAALYQLGRCYEWGAGVAPDLTKAYLHYQRAAALGDRRAARKAADFCLLGRGCAPDPEEALHWLRLASENGDAEAERRLDRLLAGNYEPVLPEPYDALEKAPAVFNLEARLAQARAGDAAAAYDFGLAARNGWGMYPNSRYALWWWQRATALGWQQPEAEADAALALRQMAEQGSLAAAYDLAESWLDQEALRGLGRQWLARAAQGGHFPAQARWGEVLLQGIAGPAEPAEGLRWLKRAAAAGSPLGQYHLAVALASGQGGELDPPRALPLYRQSALAGYFPAQVDIAFILATGQIKGGDRREASAWYLALAGLHGVVCPPDTAAREIRAKAETEPGMARGVWAVLQKVGFGTPVDPVGAAAWSRLAEETKSNLYALAWYEDGTKPEEIEAYLARWRDRALAVETPP